MKQPKTMRITKRNSEVLELLSTGHITNDIAKKLKISPRTVEVHYFRIKVILGAKTLHEALYMAGSLGLVDVISKEMKRRYTEKLFDEKRVLVNRIKRTINRLK